MSSLTTWLVTKVIEVIAFIIPALGVSPELTERFDSVIALVIGLIQTAGWFIPLDVFVMCFVAITVADNWGIVVRVIKWVIGVLPFT